VARLRLKLEYDGSAFQGWQLQSNAPSVQRALEVAIADVTGETVRVHGAGRTDAGVHALGQVAHLDTASTLAPEAFRRALNAVLPQGVSVLETVEVDPRFHARHDAVGKTYRYRILNRPDPSPLRAAQTWHIRRDLDVARMSQAAAHLVGDNDFAAFRGATDLRDALGGVVDHVIRDGTGGNSSDQVFDLGKRLRPALEQVPEQPIDLGVEFFRRRDSR